MSGFKSALQHNRRLQLGLVVIILGLLLGITYWQSRAVDRSGVAEDSSLPAQLKISAPAQAKVGETLKVRVVLDTKGAATNTVTANFSYPTDKLKFKEVVTEDSFVKIWFDKRAQDGQILLTGALPSPGFKGNRTLATVVFKVTAEGTAELAFSNQVQVFKDQTSRDILGGSFDSRVNLLP